MRIILDTDKKQIIVPWNYAQKLDEINRIGADFGGEGFQKQTFSRETLNNTSDFRTSVI